MPPRENIEKQRLGEGIYKLPDVAAATREEDKAHIKISSVGELRRKARLLKEDKTDEAPEAQLLGVKEEAARRIEAYTTDAGKGWRQLDYEQYGTDSNGFSHEKYVGLGDILVDPEINAVLIKKREGGKTPILMAHRSILKLGKRGERVAFLDDQGRYVATHTGDQFKIVPRPAEEDAFTSSTALQQLQIESGVREKGAPEGAKTFSRLQLRDIPGGAEHVNSSEPLDENDIARKLDKHAPNEGEKIVDYSKKVCALFHVPVTTLWAILKFESGSFNPAVVNPDSNATGLGQFIPNTWRTFMAYCDKNRIHDPEWGSDPLTLESRKNPYISLYATVWYTHQNEQALDTSELPIEERTTLDYLAHHEGADGARGLLEFLRMMEKKGVRGFRAIVEFQRQHPDEFDQIAKGTLTRGQYTRLRDKGLLHNNSSFMAYFRYGAKTGAWASAGQFTETPRALA